MRITELEILKVPPSWVWVRVHTDTEISGLGEPFLENHAEPVIAEVRRLGPLFWLAARLAKNRERIGVHYRSDSLASRRLAGGIWSSIFDQPGAATHIEVPTLRRVLARARAEWA